MIRGCKKCVSKLCILLEFITEIYSYDDVSILSYTLLTPANKGFVGVNKLYVLCIRCIYISQSDISVNGVISMFRVCKYVVYILFEYIAEILLCVCCSKYFLRWWNDFYVFQKVKVKSDQGQSVSILLWLFGKHKNHFIIVKNIFNTIHRTILAIDVQAAT